MSTIPLTLIEGAIAVPRTRPFAHLPPSFGAEWSPLPPGYRFRVELKAFYAAVLHTFCLNDEDIFSSCRWDPLAARRSPVAKVETANNASQGFDAARNIASPILVAPASITQMPETSWLETALTKKSGTWLRLAGGACALSGVAVLAWLAAGPFGQHRGNSELMSVKAESAQPAPKLVEQATRHAPSVPAIVPAQNATPQVLTESAAHDTTRPLDNASRPGVPHVHRAGGASHSSAPVKAKLSSRTVMAGRQEPHFPPQPLARQGQRKPSVDGAYSPTAPSRLGIDEYADLTAVAGANADSLAVLHRPASPTTKSISATQDTEWANRLSHHRITDMPEQFTH